MVVVVTMVVVCAGAGVFVRTTHGVFAVRKRTHGSVTPESKLLLYNREVGGICSSCTPCVKGGEDEAVVPALCIHAHPFKQQLRSVYTRRSVSFFVVVVQSRLYSAKAALCRRYEGCR